jgi:hypothetical protein
MYAQTSTRPGQPHPHDFPSWDAYQAARREELTRARILNMRATNPHLSLVRIAAHTGVSVQRVKAILGLPDSYPGH